MTSNSVRIRGLPLKINDYEYLGIAQEGIQQKPAHQRGAGNSIEEAVVLESAGPLNDYLSLEYLVMDLISI